jgi:uncharacterized protein (DUF433 family)
VIAHFGKLVAVAREPWTTVRRSTIVSKLTEISVGGTRDAIGSDASGTVGLVKFERVTIEPGKMGGEPCIRGLRVPVATVVAMVADGMTTEEILEDLPYLEREDISEALHFAAAAVMERGLPLQRPA